MSAVITKDEWLDVLAKIQDLEKRLEVLEDTKYTATIYGKEVKSR